MIKEITIGRSRKWAWDYGNGIGYTISVTVEGEDVEEMRQEAIKEIHKLEDHEEDRCRTAIDLLEYLKHNGEGEKPKDWKNDRIGLYEGDDLPGRHDDSTPLPVVREVDPTNDVIEYDGKTFQKFVPCKYKCGMFTAWGKPYKQGDKKLHINPMTKEILGYNCPAFEGGG